MAEIYRTQVTEFKGKVYIGFPSNISSFNDYHYTGTFDLDEYQLLTLAIHDINRTGKISTQNCKRHCLTIEKFFNRHGLFQLLFHNIRLLKIPIKDTNKYLTIFNDGYQIHFTTKENHLNSLELANLNAFTDTSFTEKWCNLSWVIETFLPKLEGGCFPELKDEDIEIFFWHNYSEPLDLVYEYFLDIDKMLNAFKSQPKQKIETTPAKNLLGHVAFGIDNPSREKSTDRRCIDYRSLIISNFSMYIEKLLHLYGRGYALTICKFQDCLKPFLSTRNDKKYCSEKCRIKANKKTYIPKNNKPCAICGNTLPRGKRKYCSDSCFKKNDAKRKKKIRKMTKK